MDSHSLVEPAPDGCEWESVVHAICVFVSVCVLGECVYRGWWGGGGAN